uniref:Uncharacterized protein n=1 Tax=Iridovirus Liz-CrIV TaxID=2594309 RepID=A0A5B8RK23_9VIRU|nr:putative protein 373L [Iridovirus Liz-CrIV]
MIEIIISTIFILYILLTKYKYETFKVIRTLIKNYKEIPLQNITLSENNEVTVEDKRIKIVTITIHGNKHMVKYKFNNKLFTALLPCTESEYQFHITTKNGIDVTENVIKFMGPNYDFYGVKIKVNEIGYDSLMFHKPGKEPTILKSNDYLPNNLSDYQWDFSLCVPPSQENIEKIIETPTTDNMMKQEVKEVSQHSVGKTVSNYLNFDNAYNGTPPPLF